MPCRSVPGGISQHALQVSPKGGVSNFSGGGCGLVPGGGVSPIFGGLQFFGGGGNGQRSAGTHPTGMHSCYDIIFLLIYSSFSIDP